jgi:TolA-binding protein
MRTAYSILFVIAVCISPARADVVSSDYTPKTPGGVSGHGDSFLHRSGGSIGRVIVTRTSGLRYAYDNVFKSFREPPTVLLDVSFIISPKGSVEEVSAEGTYVSNTADERVTETALRVFENKIEKTFANIRFRDITGPYSYDACDWTVTIPVLFVPENATKRETTPEDWPNTSSIGDRDFKYYERVEKRETDEYIIEECIIDGVEFDEIVVKSTRAKPIPINIPPVSPPKTTFDKAAKNLTIELRDGKPVKDYLRDVGSYYDKKNVEVSPPKSKKLAACKRNLSNVETSLANEQLITSTFDLGISREYDWDIKKPEAKKTAKLREKQSRLNAEIETLRGEINAVEETRAQAFAYERAELITRGEELLGEVVAPAANPWPSLALADLYLDAGEGEKAAPLFERVIEAGDRAAVPEALYGLAHAYADGGDEEKAAQLFLRLATEYANSPYRGDVCFRLGEYFTSRGEAEKAEEYYLLAAEADAQYRDAALYRAAWGYYECSNPFGTLYYDRAVPAFKRFLDEADEGSEYWDDAIKTAGLCLAEWASVTEGRLTPKDGIALFDEEFRQPTEESSADEILLALGDAYYYTLNQPREAINTFETFVTRYPLDPRIPHVYLKIADCYVIEWESDSTREKYVALVDEYGPGSEWYRQQNDLTRYEAISLWADGLYWVARDYHRVGYFDYRLESPEVGIKSLTLATKYYRKYLAYFPLNAFAPRVNYHLADAYYDLRDYDSAVEEYIRTATAYADTGLYPTEKWDEWGFKCADCYFRAFSTLKESLEREGGTWSSPSIFTYVIDNPLPDAGLHSDGESKLVRIGNEFVDLYPDSVYVPEVLFELADLYYQVGDIQNARKAIASISKCILKNRATLSELDVNYYSVNATTYDARFYLEESKLLPDGSPEARELLGNARAEYEKAKEYAAEKDISFKYFTLEDLE